MDSPRPQQKINRNSSTPTSKKRRKLRQNPNQLRTHFQASLKSRKKMMKALIQKASMFKLIIHQFSPHSHSQHKYNCNQVIRALNTLTHLHMSAYQHAVTSNHQLHQIQLYIRFHLSRITNLTINNNTTHSLQNHLLTRSQFHNTIKARMTI